MSHILVLNLGSSSIKFHLFEKKEKNSSDRSYWEQLSLVLHGLIDRIGEDKSKLKVEKKAQESQKKEQEEKIETHSQALDKILELVKEEGKQSSSSGSTKKEGYLNTLMFIGHRVVHGGLPFQGQDKAFLIDKDALEQIEKASELAPLHNPVNIVGIKECMKKFKDIPQIAAFDTSFHHTMPPVAYQYAIPKKHIDTQIRKYGFHGISHEYVSKESTKFLMKSREQSSESELRLITLHLGNGCSACAIKGGKSLDTSMGLTPLQGLVMGTRCGDIDPAVIFYLLRKEKNLNQESVDNIEKLLNEKSGLKGLCGANDMRSIVELMKEKNDEDAKQAFEMFCYRIRQYVGSYFATLGGCDAIIFTAGIGENSPDVRREVCKGLECIGVQIDNNLNDKAKADKITDISGKDSRVRVLVVPTDEEKQIAVMGLKLLEKASM